MTNIRFTTRAKVLAGILAGFAFALLVVNVMQGWQGAKCEALYNVYESTVDMQARDDLFIEGLNNGCFHYN